MSDSQLRIGTGGWSWLGDLKEYAQLFQSVEINTSFYGTPKLETFLKWANSVPDDFIFSVKLFQGFTHIGRLANVKGLDEFVDHMSVLGNKLGPLLIQLPPSLAFNRPIAAKFFAALRELYAGDIVCEPRHGSWFNTAVDQLLVEHHIARVAADPRFVEEMGEPGGWEGVMYYRLHGSPTSETPYSTEYLQALAAKLLKTKKSAQAWCIFDNAAIYARPNALDLIKYLDTQRS